MVYGLWSFHPPQILQFYRVETPLTAKIARPHRLQNALTPQFHRIYRAFTLPTRKIHRIYRYLTGGHTKRISVLPSL